MPKATCLFIRPPTLQAHSLPHEHGLRPVIFHDSGPCEISEKEPECYLFVFVSDIRAYPEANVQPNVLWTGSKQHMDHPLESSST